MFKVTARTILELGAELISSDIIAFFELIKNGFDAGTKNGIEIRFHVVLGQRDFQALERLLANYASTDVENVRGRIERALNADSGALLDEARELLDGASSLGDLGRVLEDIYALNTITVSDTGSGMSINELEDVFLVIGTSSRKKAVESAVSRNESKSPYLGEKGIGRLSAMRLGNTLTVHTARERDKKLNCLHINWRVFDNLDAMLDQVPIEPVIGETKETEDWSGTHMIIGRLSSDWTKKRVTAIARDDFSLLTDPLAHRRNKNRIAIFWNEERIAIPSIDKALLSYAHASIKGGYKITNSGPVLEYETQVIDLGFDHPPETDRVQYDSNDLLSMIVGKDSGLDLTALENVGPFSFEAYWFNRRRLGAVDGVGDRAAVKKLHAQWSGIRLYRDGFRVYPYGSEEDDWLNLDRKALMSKGYTLNKIQFVGQVNISRMGNPQLIDQTNREGLRETPEQRVLIETLRYAIQDDLRQAMLRVEKQYKERRIDFSGAKDQIESLEKRATDAIRELKRTASTNERETVADLQQTLFEFADFAKRARKRVEEVEADSQKMLDMAGVGLLVEVVAHELARASENALENLNSLSSNQVPEEVSSRLESLRSHMKTISKRLRVLDPLSVSGRQRAEKFSVTKLIEDTIEAHEAQFRRHDIEIEFLRPSEEVRARLVKGMAVQVLENLISNSVYWLALEADRRPGFKGKLTLSLESNPITIIFEDNGPGISPVNSDKVFELFFSLKEKNRRRGLGLYIARECAIFNGGSLDLDAEKKNASGRINRFVYQLLA